MTNPHLLVVETSDNENWNGYSYRVECPGVTDTCRAWLECLEPGCPPFAPDTEAEEQAQDDGEFVNHGDIHEQVCGMWCVATSDCYIATHYDLWDAAADLGVPGPGSYPVRGASDGEGELTLQLVEQEVT